MRRDFEASGYTVYVSTNTFSLTVTRDGWKGGEMDVHVKVRP